MAGGRRILVVEDDADLQGMVELLLADAGYSVATAAEGGEALARVEAEMPDLILLDMKMPGMNGWEFAERFRASHGRSARIVVMTAAEDAGKRAEEIHADGYLEKPFDVDAALRLVAELTR